jgi:CRISPR-associated protein Csb1
MTDLAHLLKEPRIKIVAELEPIAGTRFQPTGFPDLGPATYASPVDGRRLLLVESAQSMANWLEGRLWDARSNEPSDAVGAFPYVRVFDGGGEYLTSSRTESHRLASAYVKDAKFGETTGLELIRERLGLAKQRPIDHARVARAVFDLDPLCLLHGIFFADEKWPGQPKIARAITAFVEAAGVQEAYSGGVKFDHVSNAGDKEAGKAAEQGYGNVPFARTEFVAESIEASFVVDVSQIRRYALQDRERELLLALALYEIRSLLDEGLRLRTACDLAVGTVRGELPTAFELPDLGTLEQAIRERVTEQRPPLDGVYGV